MSDEESTAPGELDDLIAAGKVTPPTITGPFPVPTHSTRDNSVSEALIAIGEEERW